MTKKIVYLISSFFLFIFGICVGMCLIEPLFSWKDRSKSFIRWEYNFQNNDYNYTKKCLEYYSQKTGIRKEEREGWKIGDEFFYLSRDFEICLPKKYENRTNLGYAE